MDDLDADGPPLLRASGGFLIVVVIGRRRLGFGGSDGVGGGGSEADVDVRTARSAGEDVMEDLRKGGVRRHDRRKSGKERTQINVTLQARSSALTNSSLFSEVFFIPAPSGSACFPDIINPGVAAGLGAPPLPTCPITSSIPLAAASAARTSETPCNSAGKSKICSGSSSSSRGGPPPSPPRWRGIGEGGRGCSPFPTSPIHSKPRNNRQIAAAETAGTDRVEGA